MKTTVMTMVMMVLVSMNINAKTNNDSWRNANKRGNAVVVVDKHHNGKVDGKADKRKFDNRHDKHHRHHDCILVKKDRHTFVCKVCGARYNADIRRK